MYHPDSSPVEICEPFRGALLCRDLRQVVEAEADSPQQWYSRAVVRIAAGQFEPAAQDLRRVLKSEHSTQGQRTAARIELEFVGTRLIGDRTPGAEDLEQQIRQLSQASRLRARGYHVLGLNHLLLRKIDRAVDSLLQAKSDYHELGDRWGGSVVMDSLGTVEASRGNNEVAAYFYALSIVDKSLLGDLFGLAITLGNLARLQLRAGRLADAIDCFERDLEIAGRIGDQRGRVAVLGDLGRTTLAQGDFDRAENLLAECRALATQTNDEVRYILATKDLASVELARANYPACDRYLVDAEQRLVGVNNPTAEILVRSIRVELKLAQNDQSAVQDLRTIADDCLTQQLFDEEARVRIQLAQCLILEKQYRAAVAELERSLGLVRDHGISRYRESIDQLFALVGPLESSLEEPPRELQDNSQGTTQGYHRLERLGGGAFGEVYRVYDPQRNMILARKELRLANLYDSQQRTRIINSAKMELEAASAIRHPGIARVIAVAQSPDGNAYVLQEYIDGKSLRHYIPHPANKPLAPLLECLARIADSLEALHETGFIHRDIKPDNILIRGDGSPVIVDFGLAHLVTPHKAPLATSVAASSSEAVGTIEYMAPEQARGDAVDGRADLFSLAVVAVEWLSGHRPKSIDTKRSGMIRTNEKRVQFSNLLSARDDIPESLVNLLSAMLAVRARKRPPNANAVAIELRSIIAQR